MKMKHLFAMVCVLLLAVSMASFASAEKGQSQETKVMDYADEPYLIQNGETAKFMVFYVPGGLFAENESWYRDIDFDCDEVVKGKVLSGSSWIKVRNTKMGPRIKIADNESTSQRKGKVQITGNKFKATIVFTQLGRAYITMCKRSKKTVTLKFQNCTGPRGHYLYIDEYSTDESGYVDWNHYTYYSIYNGLITATSYKFKVRKGYQYQIGYGPSIVYESGGSSTSITSWCSFLVESLSGSENYMIQD